MTRYKLFYLFLINPAAAGKTEERGKIPVSDGPLGPTEQTYDFPPTAREAQKEWSLDSRCGQSVTGGTGVSQRGDVKCPNVLLINSDDQTWGDISINNPSKLIPTPNIDHLVSKGINFRDGHACSARCAPSRYCLLTGRHHFRRANYHYGDIDGGLEYGRKIISHLFKRNNYKTLLVGKDQPIGKSITERNGEEGAFYYLEGTKFWAFDKSFASKNFCCFPGGGYFVNDVTLTNYDRYAIFTGFRDAGLFNDVLAPEPLVNDFLNNPENFHLLDGYTVDGNPESALRPTTYMAYWAAIEKGFGSGLNDARRRRRRGVNGKRLRRDTGGVVKDNVIHEGSQTSSGTNSARFLEKATGNVLVADYKLTGEALDATFARVSYEFGADGVSYKSKEAAEAAKQILMKKVKRKEGANSKLYKKLKISQPARTQTGYDTKTMMYLHHHNAIKLITEHVQESNPNELTERTGDQNQPFFMYLAFRAPHAPYSHNLTAEETANFLPYNMLGKPGEQIGLFDLYIGNIMKALHDLQVADNTIVIFTSDNGPDTSGLKLFNKYGHLRMATMRGKKASIYEGGHRVPLVWWWPLGIHPALHGTNFDLPVSQIDFFATFAEIMEYPLPLGDKCVYAFNSENAKVHGQDASRIGRPGLHTPNPTRWLKDMKTWNWSGTSKYDSSVVVRTADGKARYDQEFVAIGPDRIEKFLTKEEKTGFILGWEGCMAEDSISFKSAFSAHKVATEHRNGKTYHKFESNLETVPTKVQTGKLGDLSIRLGRYKLIRFGTPKDIRTGPTRQHLVTQEGPQWTAARPKDRCEYDITNGKLLTPNCKVEPACRSYQTFGEVFCMRDHYYQLFDLEKNFGEKMFCDKKKGLGSTPGVNSELTEALGVGKNITARGNYSMLKSGEKPTDPFGYGIGIESSPAALFLNDCCVLNVDEDKTPSKKPNKMSRSGAGTDPCSTVRFSKKGVESTGGKCVFKQAMANKIGKTYSDFNRWADKEEAKTITKKQYGQKFGWTAETHFNRPTESEYKPGYVCSRVQPATPDSSSELKRSKQVWDGVGWRHATKMDLLCNPNVQQEATTTGPTAGPGPTAAPTPAPKAFELGCKVPDHNGPLGQGWEANRKYSESIKLERRTNPAIEDGELDPEEFGVWTPLATCLKNAMQLYEGQAYFKETETLNEHIDTNKKPIMEDGTAAGKEIQSDKILAGGIVGSSRYASENAARLFGLIKDETDGPRSFHGAGNRYNEHANGSDSIVLKCLKFLPDHVKSNPSLQPNSIQPNYDLEMDLLGWYDTRDNSGGSLKELVVEGRDEQGDYIYSDDRRVQKYYTKPVGGNYPTYFRPQY